ncbi:DUF560 domain-containing protein [Salmonella enterica]|nr:DUF560 domain-containing protein [Salmonella enterica]
MKIITFMRLKPGKPPAMVSFIFLLFSTFTSAKEQTLETGNLNNKLTHYLISNNSVAVKNILQTCGECSQFIDPLLLEWSNGILARQEKNYAESIRHYRKVISIHPDWYSARLQLATVLYLNKDILSAEAQLRKLRSESLPEEAAVLIDSFIAKIQKTDNWAFRGGFTYLNEKNINNAPASGRSIGRWKSEKPQSGKGVMFWGEAEKTFSLPDNLFGITRLATSGKVPGSGLTDPLHPLMSHRHQCRPDILTVNSGFLPALLNRRTGTVFYRQWLTERYNSVVKDCRFLFL